MSDNDGRTFVVRSGAMFELLATNELGERIMASPAITGDRLAVVITHQDASEGTSILERSVPW